MLTLGWVGAGGGESERVESKTISIFFPKGEENYKTYLQNINPFNKS